MTTMSLSLYTPPGRGGLIPTSTCGRHGQVIVKVSNHHDRWHASGGLTLTRSKYEQHWNHARKALAQDPILESMRKRGHPFSQCRSVVYAHLDYLSWTHTRVCPPRAPSPTLRTGRQVHTLVYCCCWTDSGELYISSAPVWGAAGKLFL
jgi:hypothetical protein